MAYGKNASGGNAMSGLIGEGIGAAGSALAGPMGGAIAKKLWNIGGGK